MRTLKFGAVTVLMLALASQAYAGGLVTRGEAQPPHLTDHPWSVGTEIGVMVIHTSPYFNLEIPFEYTLPLGPGDLAIHAGFMLSAGGNRAYGGIANRTWRNDVLIGLPIGARYKIRVLASHPLYVWPMLDVGPQFDTWDGHPSGFFRAGAGISYLVHPHVELMFRPLTVGAAFDDNGGWFLYNMTMGAQFRF